MAALTYFLSIIILSISLFQDAKAAFRLGSYFSDHMVLQMQPSSAVIWGYGEVGATVKIYFSESTYEVVVGEEKAEAEEAIWTVTMNPQPAGGPHTIKIEDNHNNTIQLSDVYFGDVWFCSGQSNMRFEMEKIFDADTELEKAQQYTKLRFIKTPLDTSVDPREDVYPAPEPWSGPNMNSLQNFSSLCWMYGEHLYDTLNIPIGLVQSTWGGTVVEAWSSPDALYNCGIGKDLTHKLAAYKNDDSVLWNAMVYPYLKMIIRGAIWYQGESNENHNVHLYNCTFRNMINDWRTKWNEQSQGLTDPNFPFGFMQLASYEESDSMAWPLLRWHQTADIGFVPNPSMTNTFMAVGMDLPDDTSPTGCIHPRDKKTMATRLSNAGLNVAYNMVDLPLKGPQVEAIAVDQSSVLMIYDQAVKLVGEIGFKYCCLTPSSACGDNTYTEDWKTPKISQYNSTTVHLETSCAASYITYGWQQRPCEYKKCPVYSNDEYELPAAPWKWEISEQQQSCCC